MLETGYDGGRVGAWAIDAPGVFAAARTRERALTAVLTATGRTRSWLEARGDDLGLPPLGRVEVVAEIPVEREPDGYERNATIASDLRVLGPGDLATVERRLGWLRDDLLALASDIERYEDQDGALPADTKSGERTAAEVLRHVAGTEVWLVGRLDGARYDGPLDDADVGRILAGTRAWAIDRLRTLAARDDGREVADRHGETWTVAKVVRRLLYHSFDHLWELDRRLARVDGTADRVVVTLERRPTAAQTVGLMRTVGWDSRTTRQEAMGEAIERTPEMAAAWDGDRLVGTARSLTDGALQAYLATVVVHPRYQGLGVGERMMHALMDGREGVRFGLAAAPGMDEWYRKLGFIPDPNAMLRPRSRH